MYMEKCFNINARAVNLISAIFKDLDEKGKSFNHTADFDDRGILHHLATAGGQFSWVNPHELGVVKVSSSGLAADSRPVSAAVGRDVVRCVNLPKANSWFMFELKGVSVDISRYSLRHYDSWETECLRTWTFEGRIRGSINHGKAEAKQSGEKWRILKEHKNDQKLKLMKGSTGTWKIESKGEPPLVYDAFRITITGPNSNGNYFLPVSGFELYGRLYKSPRIVESKSASTRKFEYKTDLDQNGILYFLGTRCGIEAKWANPAELNMVNVSSTKLGKGSEPAESILSRKIVRCITAANRENWFQIELNHGICARISSYTLQHYKSWDAEALRCWNLEGSNDGENWVLISEHDNDCTLTKAGQSHTWKIKESMGNKFFSRFRVRQTGFNSNFHLYLALSSFEIYGEVTGISKYVREMKTKNEEMSVIGDSKGLKKSLPYDPKLPLFNKGGILYYIGKKYGSSQEWENPVKSQRVSIKSSALGSNSQDNSVLAGRATVRWVTLPCKDAFFSVTFLECRIRPSFYSLRHYASWATEALRNWILEGQEEEGSEWIKIISHTKDGKLEGVGGEAGWKIPSWERLPFLRNIRLTQVGMNSNGHYFLACSGIEFYGDVLMDAKAISKSRSDQSLAERKFSKEFKYQGVDFDENGLVYYLATNGRKSEWRNPALDKGIVSVTSSPLATSPPSSPAEAILGRKAVRCVTIPRKRSFFQIEFKNLTIKPTAYSLRHYSSFDMEAVRNWKLEGSNDLETWHTIREHKDDRALYGRGSTATWRVSSGSKKFRAFRILQNGQNSNGHWFLALSGFEIYGHVTEIT